MPPRPFPRGVFTISLDFELIWGTRDYAGVQRFRRACEVERAVVIDRLLELFATYRIPATWCIVGHLFLDRCEAVDGRKHPDLLRPRTAAGVDWFDDDPATDERSAPTFYGRELVDKIRRCAVPQEIGCHSFSHVIFDDPGCSAEVAASELRKCVEIAAGQSLRLTSFAYPRNRVAHLDVLREYGFTAYRGPEPQWYDTSWMPRPGKRLAHLASFIAKSPPPVVAPRQVGGLWNVPGSMILLPMHGVRKRIPAANRVARASKGLRRAIEQRKIFHLWFHPTNLAIEPDAMFGALEQILADAARLRDNGSLSILTMREVAEYASGAL